MKGYIFKRFVAAAIAAMPVFFASPSNENPLPPLPEIELGRENMEFGFEGGSDTVTLYVNRDWSAVTDADWIAIDPPQGSNDGRVTVTVLENAAGDSRSTSVMFRTLAVYTTLSVSQAANPDGIPSLFYGNDFDAELAVETDDRWPYLDQTECWKNETGAGADSVEYYFSGMSARSNTSSNGNYSDYDGSGNNNLFFSTNPYFVVGNIKLHPRQQAYTLSFGTERYVYSEKDNTFRPEEFPVMISPDGENWVEVEYTFASGTYLNGRWDLASAPFTLPEGTETLWIRFAPTISSAHRLDDLSLKAGGDGPVIDWSKGTGITIPGRTE